MLLLVLLYFNSIYKFLLQHKKKLDVIMNDILERKDVYVKII